MLLNLFLNNVWIAIGLWAVLYCLDYLFTVKSARMYTAGVNNHFVFSEGIELNPYFKEDIAKLRRISPRFFFLLLFTSGLLLILWSLGLPTAFEFGWGALICIQSVIHLRHIRNLAHFHYALASKGLAGKIETAHWLSLRLSSVEFFLFSALFLFIFLLWGSYFILCGATGCLSLALRHLFDSIKQKASSQSKA